MSSRATSRSRWTSDSCRAPQGSRRGALDDEPDDERAVVELAQRHVGIRREQRDRLEAARLLAPAAQHADSLAAIELRQLRAVVGAGRPERFQRLELLDRAVVPAVLSNALEGLVGQARLITAHVWPWRR